VGWGDARRRTDAQLELDRYPEVSEFRIRRPAIEVLRLSALV